MQENNKKISPIKLRILQFIDFIGISKYEFYKNTNISRGTLDNDSGLTEENIAKFLAYYKNVNPTWLLTGEGEMLRTTAVQQQGQPPLKEVPKEEQKPPGCPLCAEKERVISELNARLKDKDKIIALLERDLEECRKIIDSLVTPVMRPINPPQADPAVVQDELKEKP